MTPDKKEIIRQAIRAATDFGPNGEMNCGVAEALYEIRRLVQEPCPTCDGLGWLHTEGCLEDEELVGCVCGVCPAGCDEGVVMPDWSKR